MEEKNYPHVSDRVKAVVIDSIVLIGELVLVTYIFSLFENVPDTTKKIAFVFPWNAEIAKHLILKTVSVWWILNANAMTV